MLLHQKRWRTLEGGGGGWGGNNFLSFECTDSEWKQCKKPGLKAKDKVAPIRSSLLAEGVIRPGQGQIQLGSSLIESCSASRLSKQL